MIMNFLNKTLWLITVVTLSILKDLHQSQLISNTAFFVRSLRQQSIADIQCLSCDINSFRQAALINPWARFTPCAPKLAIFHTNRKMFKSIKKLNWKCHKMLFYLPSTLLCFSSSQNNHKYQNLDAWYKFFVLCFAILSNINLGYSYFYSFNALHMFICLTCVSIIKYLKRNWYEPGIFVVCKCIVLVKLTIKLFFFVNLFAFFDVSGQPESSIYSVCSQLKEKAVVKITEVRKLGGQI